MKLIDTINKILEARNQHPLDEYEEQEVREALGYTGKVITESFSHMIGGINGYGQPDPTIGSKIADFLEENPQYRLIDQIDTSDPRSMNMVNAKAFFQQK